MPKVEPYPFDQLPQLTQAETQLKKRLINSYSFLENRQDLFNELLKPLQDLVKSPVDCKVIHLKSVKLDELMASLTGDVLLGCLALEPLGHKAVVLFESSLAKTLISKVLAGDGFSLDKLLGNEHKPVTALEEGVLQYLLVSVLSHIQPKLTEQNFSMAYDSFKRESQALSGIFSPKDNLAVFSVQVHFYGRDFYLKFILPVPALEQFGMTDVEDHFLQTRLQQFGKFGADIQLEVANVTLSPVDIEQLSGGDIILFDDAYADIKNGKLSGQGLIKLTSPGVDEGYRSDLEVTPDGIRARLERVE